MTTAYKSYIGAEDLSLWDGKIRTFTRGTSTGGTMTLNKLGVVVDILNLFGGGTAFTDATLSLALSHIGSTNATLVLTPGTWTLSNNVTVPLNITLFLPQGAVLSVASGKTLTINGSINAGLYQIFSGSGTVSISGTFVDEVYPQWWGGKGDGTTDDSTAIQAAVTAGKWIHITGGTWLVNTAINVRGYRHIYGAGKENTVIKAGASLTGFVFSSTDGATGAWLVGSSITDLTIDGNTSTDALGGIYAEFVTEWEFERLKIYNFYKSTAIGIQLDHAYQIAHRDCYVRMGSAGAGKKGTACFQVGASTADAIHTTHITYDNCLAQYSATGFMLADMGNRGGNMTIRQCASGNHNFGIQVKDFYREVIIESSLIENTSSRGINITTTTAYNIHNITLKELTLYECTTAIFASNVDSLGIDRVRFVGDDAGGHTCTNLGSVKRVELGTYTIEDTAYDTFAAGEDPRLSNLALNDATPSVAFGGRKHTFKTQSSAPLTITAFDDGVVGQEISIIFADANTTIDFSGTNLKGNAGVDFTGAVADRMDCVYDGTDWFCSVTKTSVLGTRFSGSKDTAYLAATDLFVQVQIVGASEILADTSNPPTTVRTTGNGAEDYIQSVVKKGEYWKVTDAGGVPTILATPIVPG